MKSTETKPFYLTSEFWIQILGQVLVWVEAIPLGGAPSWVQTAVSAALAIGYIISRGLAKGGVPYENPALAADETAQLSTEHTISSAKISAADQMRALAAENPDAVQQLKSEGVIT